MPFSYRIYAEAQMLFVRGEGVITQRERVQTMLAWMKDPAYATCLDTFCDFTAVQSTPKLSELRELIAVIGEHLPGRERRKIAIVTAKPITFGVARVFEDLVELEDVPREVKVFFDRDLAWAWLRPEGPPREPEMEREI